jgi:hypothetical protein
VIDFESGFTVNHHNDAQLFFALGAKGFGEGGNAFQTDKILCHAVYHALDDAPFARLEIAEQTISAVAFDVDYLAGLQIMSDRQHYYNILKQHGFLPAQE